MNWLPSLRALIIFGVLMALFAAAYWACGGPAKPRKALGPDSCGDSASVYCTVSARVGDGVEPGLAAERETEDGAATSAAATANCKWF